VHSSSPKSVDGKSSDGAIHNHEKKQKLKPCAHLNGQAVRVGKDGELDGDDGKGKADDRMLEEDLGQTLKFTNVVKFFSNHFSVFNIQQRLPANSTYLTTTHVIHVKFDLLHQTTLLSFPIRLS
jgi:hypothetical protein